MKELRRKPLKKEKHSEKLEVAKVTQTHTARRRRRSWGFDILLQRATGSSKRKWMKMNFGG